MRAGVVGAIVVGAGVLAGAGCGGSGGGGKTTSTAAETTASAYPAASAAAVQAAEEIKARFASAGYVVHDIPKGTPIVRGPNDETPNSRGPQVEFLAVDRTTDETYNELNGELVSIRAKARARAVKNLPMTPETFTKLAALSQKLKALGYQEFSVYVFNTTDDAATYGKSNFDTENAHVLQLPGANDYDQYETVGPVIYFRPVAETDGKVTLDKAGFAKLVAVAQGKT